jgi:hypothetical protein
LKTFLTQTGPALPLTSDPPVVRFLEWIGWKDYEVPKNRNLKSVSAKNVILLSPTRRIPTPGTRRTRCIASTVELSPGQSRHATPILLCFSSTPLPNPDPCRLTTPTSS